jgi:hypothetical protein
LLKNVRRCLWLILLMSLLAAQGPSGTFAGWSPVAEGVSYQRFIVGGPNTVYVTRMDRSNPNVILDTSLATGRLDNGTATVRQMAEASDGALNSWDPAWGGRNHVVAAINGSFHDSETGRPVGGMVESGWYLKRFTDLGGGTGLVWKLDRSLFIGGCVNQPEEGQVITYLDSGVQQVIDGVNERRHRSRLVVYTPQYGTRTDTSDGGSEIVVELSQPLTILPLPMMVTGVVRQIRESKGNTAIPFDSVVVSASDAEADKMLANVKIGSKVGFSTEIDHYETDCKTPNRYNWSETYASLSGSFEFLKDGKIQSFPDKPGANTPSPRTAVCFNDDYVFFVVVDGRQQGGSAGMTMDDLGHFCADRLGADWGINQDGGGSSTMWVDGQVVNRPSDGHERGVANALLMIEVEPPAFSTKFQPGDVIEATKRLDLLLGPGNNFNGPTDVPEGVDVKITHNGNQLDGVKATGDYWWQVEVNGNTGWVPESDIRLVAKASASASSPTPTATPPPDPIQSLLTSLPWAQDRSRSPGFPHFP